MPSSWSGSLPTSMKEVVETQNAAYYYDSDKGIDLDYIDRVLCRLTELKDSVRTKENDFYKKFNLPIGKDGMIELQRRLDELNSDYGFRMMDTKAPGNAELVNAGMSKFDPTKPFTALLKDQDEVSAFLESKAGRTTTDIAVNEFIDLLRKSIGNIKTKDLEVDMKQINKSSTGSRGLSRYINKVSLNDAGLFTIHLDKALPQSWNKRLEELMKNMQGSQNDIGKTLWTWLEPNFTNAKIKQCVYYEFNKRIKQYKLGNNPAVIKGFLGEVKANAFMSYLCGRSGVSIPTGIMTNSAGQEIPIDMVIKGTGFQIKNYDIGKDGNSFFIKHDQMGMDTFIDQRLRPEADVYADLIKFFGSYDFNRPVKDATPQYETVYSRFSNSIDRVENLFYGYTDNILKISDVFESTAMNMFGKKNLYFNTFFIVNNKILPSSVLLEAIIQTFRNSAPETYINSYYQIIAPSESTSTKKWSREDHYSDSDVMNYVSQTKITYSFDIKLARILNAAYSSALY